MHLFRKEVRVSRETIMIVTASAVAAIVVVLGNIFWPQQINDNKEIPVVPTTVTSTTTTIPVEPITTTPPVKIPTTTKPEVKPKTEEPVKQIPAVIINRDTAAELEIIERTNNARLEAGLNPLSISVKLSNAALLKLQDMKQYNYFKHTSDQGKDIGTFIDQVGYYYEVRGENLARGFNNMQETFEGWRNSPTHWENILEPRFDEIGVAVADNVVVQVFALNSHFDPSQYE